MIGDYLVVALVFGIVLSYVAIIHHFGLRDAFKEEAPLDLPAAIERKSEISSHETFCASKTTGHALIGTTIETSASMNNTTFGGTITAGILELDLRPAEVIHRDSPLG